jgi:hypothetical protein
MIKFIRQESGAGISNTLRNLIAAIWEAEIIHKIPLDYSQITDLLTLDIPTFESNNNNITKEIKGRWSLPTPNIYKDNHLYEMDKKLFLIFDTKITEARGIDFQYFNIRTEIRDIFINMFKRITFHEFLTKEVEFFLETFDYTNTVGVHARTWKGYVYRNLICFDEDLLFNTLSNIKAENILLISDDMYLIQEAKKRFSNIITCKDIFNNTYSKYPSYIKINDDNTTYTFFDKKLKLDYFQAVFEMLVLSKCKRIIGSYESTFTDCAWWFSGCKPITILETDTVMSLNKRYQKRYKAL